MLRGLRTRQAEEREAAVSRRTVAVGYVLPSRDPEPFQGVSVARVAVSPEIMPGLHAPDQVYTATQYVPPGTYPHVRARGYALQHCLRLLMTYTGDGEREQ